jgi:predicted tellurium resistance membrane protein TerC
MSVRVQIASLVFLMVQAVLFGTGAMLVLATPLAEMARSLMPLVVVFSLGLSIPISWHIAPRLQVRRRARPQLRLVWSSGA